MPPRLVGKEPKLKYFMYDEERLSPDQYLKLIQMGEGKSGWILWWSDCGLIRIAVNEIQRLKGLESDYNVLKSEIGTLKNSNDKLLAKLTEVTEALNQKMQQLVEAQQQLKAGQNQVQAYHRANENLRIELKTVSEKYDSLVSAIRSHLEEIL